MADLYEAPELADRVVAALPAEIVHAFDLVVDCFHRPHPLVVRTPEKWWSCANCGTGFDEEAQERALVVTGREGFSALEEDITYCRAASRRSCRGGVEMSDNEALPRPPSLQAFLDAGCDLLESEVWVERLAEVAFLELPFTPPRERREQAQQGRWIANTLLAEADPTTWGRVLLEHWRSDLYADPAVAERLQEALPTALTSRYRALADLHRRPYPMEVRLPDEWWSCSSCGAAFDEGEQEALVITGREDHSELRREITYCFECVGTLVDVVGNEEPA